MPAALLAWMLAHQAIAAMVATYIGLTAAGIDVVDKGLELKDHLQNSVHIEKDKEGGAGE